MTSSGTARLIAAVFGLSAFAVAVISGLAVGNPSVHVLTTALVSMVVCQVVGLAMGAVAQRIIEDHITSYRDARPAQAVEPNNQSTVVPPKSVAPAPSG